MYAQIRRLCLILAATSALGACTYKIKAPEQPIRIEMTVVLKHEFVVDSDAAGG